VYLPLSLRPPEPTLSSYNLHFFISRSLTNRRRRTSVEACHTKRWWPHPVDRNQGTGQVLCSHYTVLEEPQRPVPANSIFSDRHAVPQTVLPRDRVHNSVYYLFFHPSLHTTSMHNLNLLPFFFTRQYLIKIFQSWTTQLSSRPRHTLSWSSRTPPGPS
jgi:hypothetical protein